MRKATTLILTLATYIILSQMSVYAQSDPKADNKGNYRPHYHMDKIAHIQIDTPKKARPLFKADTLKIIILGDLMMHTKQIQTARKNNDKFDFSSYFRHLQTMIADADIAIGNMEFTLGGAPYTGYPAFSAPDQYAEYLAATGFDIFLCANNHIFDKGSKGAERTLAIYEELNKKYGILHTGLTDYGADKTSYQSNNPLILIRKGIKLAFVNYTYGTNSGVDSKTLKVNKLSDRESLKNALTKSKDADFSIVLPHWGEEYMLTHSSGQRKHAEFMVECGADIIIGSHPHTVQDLEKINGVPVVYSLGNAVSNMSAPNTQVGLMTEIIIVRSENGDVNMEEPRLIWLWCSRPGGYCDDYTVIPIKDFIGTRNEWVGKWEYDKMVSSWYRVASETAIGM